MDCDIKNYYSNLNRNLHDDQCPLLTRSSIWKQNVHNNGTMGEDSWSAKFMLGFPFQVQDCGKIFFEAREVLITINIEKEILLREDIKLINIFQSKSFR